MYIRQHNKRDYTSYLTTKNNKIISNKLKEIVIITKNTLLLIHNQTGIIPI